MHSSYQSLLGGATETGELIKHLVINFVYSTYNSRFVMPKISAVSELFGS